MASTLETVSKNILEPSALQLGHLDGFLNGLLGKHIDAGDLYFQTSQQESWVMDDGILREGSFSIEKGVGIRAMSEEKTGFAYCDDLHSNAITQAVGNARAIVKQGQSGGTKIALANQPTTALYTSNSPIDGRSADDKVELLKQLDQYTRSLDQRIEQVIISLSGGIDHILVAATDNTLAADIRPLVRLNVTVLMHQGERREQGSAGGGGRHAYDIFFDSDRAYELARDAVRQAATNLESVATPAGTMPVVLGPGWPGVLLHEAVGHGLEGDFNRKGTSAFSNRIGELVASPLCTVVDDGTIKDRRGSLSVDDEGVPAQNTTLIENGVLKGYMQDKMNARLMGTQSTSNGRRESFAHLPMPRMTNTYMLPGESEPEEIIASVDKGLYAVNFGGGQVDITSGRFVFSLSEAYLIENGKISAPVKGATLIGSGPEVMGKISMVGNDLQLDQGVGVCGKEGQAVPVGVGQPSLKIDEITVGGTD
ncbi:MAG: TldD protein, part of TldE/TldD proteolytic complex [Olavius algarvensis Gamma 3 endosymbiont]|nr:MAG: TldD protein, part of TldE/TldD proteolytic complex [Olavius algarvensis Gamma 3 endosymbiont]